MPDILEIALAGMRFDLARVERVGMNLANVLTPAWRREVLMPAAPARPFEAYLGAAPGSDVGNLAHLPPSYEVLIDARPGTLRSTGMPLDLALAGEGYFELSTSSGLVYTRQGNLRLDASGRLVSATGQAVLGHGGEIHPGSQAVRIDEAGRMTENGRLVDQIRVVRFERPAALQRLGDGLFGATPQAGAPLPGNDGQVLIRQGMLENANVNTAQEMIELTRATRHFESLQRLSQSYDELIGLAIRRLSE
jgi:flagellar basal-body rod protein FlgF